MGCLLADNEGSVAVSLWKQERPEWCPHRDCKFKRRAQDALCCGHLPEPVPHDEDFNIFRICLNGVAERGGVLDLQINKTDIYHFRRMFAALAEDGK